MANDVTAIDTIKPVLNAKNASMTLTFPDGKSEVYKFDEPPAKGSTLVLAAEQEILTDLNLNELTRNLYRVTELLYLAYCGVAGVKDIWADISDRRATHMKLCGECVTVMTDFKDTARHVSVSVAESFSYLVDGDERSALAELAKSAKEAARMATKSQELAERFSKLGDQVQGDQHNTLQATTDEVAKLAKIRADREKMAAAIAKQNATNDDLAANIASLQTLYNDAKSREEEADKRAFITGIVSGATAALGSAIGAYTAAKNPLAAAAANLRQPDQPGQPADPTEGEGEEDPPAPAPTKPKPAKPTEGDDDEDPPASAPAKPTAAKPDDGGDDETNGDTPAADKPSSTGGKPSTTGGKSDDGDGGDKPEEDDGDSTASKPATLKAGPKKTGKTKEDKERQARQDREEAAQGAGAAAGLNSASGTLSKMSDQQAKAGESIRQEKMRLLEAKLAAEAEKRKVVANLAELASKMSSNETEQKIHESAEAALQIAVWAFANITTTLMLAKHFWDNVKGACERLADSDLRDKIKQHGDDDKEDRIRFYLGRHFMPSAIGYMARWVALEDLGDQYTKGAILARDHSVQTIDAAPTIEEAHKILSGLKGKIMGELADDKLLSDGRTEKVKAEMAVLAKIN